MRSRALNIEAGTGGGGVGGGGGGTTVTAMQAPTGFLHEARGSPNEHQAIKRLLRTRPALRSGHVHRKALGQQCSQVPLAALP